MKVWASRLLIAALVGTQLLAGRGQPCLGVCGPEAPAHDPAAAEQPSCCAPAGVVQQSSACCCAGKSSLPKPAAGDCGFCAIRCNCAGPTLPPVVPAGVIREVQRLEPAALNIGYTLPDFDWTERTEPAVRCVGTSWFSTLAHPPARLAWLRVWLN